MNAIPDRSAAVLFVALTAAAAGCMPAQRPVETTPSNDASYANAAYGVTLRYPADLTASRGFSSDYLLAQRWNPDAPADQAGQALLSLTLPESNHLLDARLRLGASQSAQAVSDCVRATAAKAANANQPIPVTVGGEPFQRVDSGDAAMSHFLSRHSYRGVVHGRCYAIDLVVSGVRPEVYPDNPTPPMTQDAAFQRLAALLDGLSFSQ
ncbi:hypothetical protein [Salinisphaera aquimarina]|uniref:Lipoprotein n=1 Tax=Salinisphaera aquimarina TaxID=2094031 RepID=A0ABV7EPI6_9GAMM